MRNADAHLCLSESERGGEFRAFRKRQVLGPLEASVQLLQLETGVDGAGFPHLLAFAVDADAGFQRVFICIQISHRQSCWVI